MSENIEPDFKQEFDIKMEEKEEENNSDNT
jgi:hypothetical protein